MYGKDLTGMTFGRLTVIKRDGKSKDGRWIWLCRCNNDGNLVRVVSKNLLNGDTQSCGCIKKEVLEKRNTTHKMTNTRFYRIWKAMHTRCNNEHTANYKNYGGRGIIVCIRWKEFENFKEDMYESYLNHVKEYGEKDTTLDRIDVNGNYEPSNCRWATLKEQANNTRCLTLTYNGETHKVSEWTRILGLSRDVIWGRLSRCMPIDLVLYKGDLRNYPRYYELYPRKQCKKILTNQ